MIKINDKFIIKDTAKYQGFFNGIIFRAVDFSLYGKDYLVVGRYEIKAADYLDKSSFKEKTVLLQDIEVLNEQT